MGKDDNASESQFGFKDEAKAKETIRLLQEHELQYQKLTVRGLLGRAKRVLQMTKAEEKINNIKAAIAVFEDWIEQNTANSSSKSTKSTKDDNDKPETVPGLGFKDKEAALNTLKILKGRDPNYQKLAVKGLLGNGKRVLQSTKNEDKIRSIKEGLQILEDFLEDFDRENRASKNMAYLPANVVTAFGSPKNQLCVEFIEVYDGKAKGRYEHLRTLYPNGNKEKSWDIVRNGKLAEIQKKIQENKTKLFNDDGSPTKDHLELIHWAFSPNADKLKAYVDTRKGKSSSQKRKSSNDDASVTSKKSR